MNKANSLGGNARIHVAEGTYKDPVGTTVKISVPNVRIFGSTVLERDERGLPTRNATSVAKYVPWGNTTLLTVTRSHFAITGMVFDGGGTGTLLRVDGGDEAPLAPTRRSLVGIAIHGNHFVNAAQGLSLRRANATIAGNFLAWNEGACQVSGGYEPDADHPVEQEVTFAGNRVFQNSNSGVSFGGFLNSNQAPAYPPGPGQNTVSVVGNDFTGNGAIEGVAYPAPIQYGALLLLTMHVTSSDPLQTARIRATIRGNSFNKNGYGVAVAVRLPVSGEARGYSCDAMLSENSYCSNGLNNLLADFSLPAQSHMGAAGGAEFRYAMGSVYRIDARGDGLGLDDLDYDHPKEDPRLPATAKGTLLLGNVLIFNGQWVPPLPTHLATDAPPGITRPPMVGPNAFAPIETVDRDPPTIRSAVAVPSVLWPPDHKMVPVALLVDAVDRCDRRLTYRITSVTGGGNGDHMVTGPLSLLLRAEQEPGPPGPGRLRRYGVTVECTDAAGNSAANVVRVTVPASVP